MYAQKNTCRICFNYDVEADQIFYVALCDHWFCVECVKGYIEAKLQEGSVVIMRCPQYQCGSKLTIRSCANILTPKLRAMWQRKIKEESIPVKDRVYCPNPRCSALMSESELIRSTEKACGSMRCCSKCGELFCINCKVKWHSNLSCKDYKRLGPNPTKDDMMLKVLANRKSWRQCKRCKHVIELSEGCIHVTCRCGYEFCYTCGAPWNEGRICIHSTISGTECVCIFVIVIVFIIVITLSRIYYDMHLSN